MALERGDTRIVGVNAFTDDAAPPAMPAPDYSALEREQVARVQAVRARRDASAVDRCLTALWIAARSIGESGGGQPIVPLIVDAVRSRASVGEISDALTRAWGLYHPQH
jgi:methylmalonyl-CoA mutase N-terminal domain/subunit